MRELPERGCPFARVHSSYPRRPVPDRRRDRAIHAAGLRRPVHRGDARAGLGRCVGGGDGRPRGAPRGPAPAPDQRRHDGAASRGRGGPVGRAVRRDEGADRGLRRDRGRGSRRGDRGRLQASGGDVRSDRGEAVLGGVTPTPVVQAAVADAFRREWGSVVATLIRTTGDWDLAEECAQDAFAEALKRWPDTGVPRRPGGWLTTVARNRALDRLRRKTTEAIKLKEAAVLSNPTETDDDGNAIGDD